MTNDEAQAILDNLAFKKRHTTECQTKNGLKPWEQLSDSRKRCACAYWSLGVHDRAEGFKRKSTGETSRERAKGVYPADWGRPRRMNIHQKSPACCHYLIELRSYGEFANRSFVLPSTLASTFHARTNSTRSNLRRYELTFGYLHSCPAVLAKYASISENPVNWFSLPAVRTRGCTSFQRRLHFAQRSLQVSSRNSLNYGFAFVADDVGWLGSTTHGTPHSSPQHSGTPNSECGSKGPSGIGCAFNSAAIGF